MRRSLGIACVLALLGLGGCAGSIFHPAPAGEAPLGSSGPDLQQSNPHPPMGGNTGA